MEKLEQLNLELESLREKRDRAEKEFSKKFQEVQDERAKIIDSLPDIYGIVTKTNTACSLRLHTGDVYALDYNEDMEPVFHTYQRNYNEYDTEYNHCPHCCKMNIVKREELTNKQRLGVIYNVYR